MIGWAIAVAGVVIPVWANWYLTTQEHALTEQSIAIARDQFVEARAESGAKSDAAEPTSVQFVQDAQDNTYVVADGQLFQLVPGQFREVVVGGEPLGGDPSQRIDEKPAPQAAQPDGGSESGIANSPWIFGGGAALTILIVTAVLGYTRNISGQGPRHPAERL